MQDFEARVLTQLDAIQERVETIELRVSGSAGDPNNQGVLGKLKAVDDEIEDVNERQRRLTDSVRLVKEDQGRQRAWLKGMAAGLTLTGVTGVVTLARMLGVG